METGDKLRHNGTETGYFATQPKQFIFHPMKQLVVAYRYDKHRLHSYRYVKNVNFKRYNRFYLFVRDN